MPQLFWLQRLGALYLDRREYLQAAHCLNGALHLLLSHPSDFEGKKEALTRLITSQLERVEGLFLEERFQRKSPGDHRDYLIRYRKELDSIRLRFAERLNGGLAIEEAQELLTKSYRNLLIALIEESIELIGQGRPSGFAVMGLGSMARMEMCPYSDLEFAFLIEEPSPGRLDYFRKLSQLLTLKMVNMGETHFPLVRFKRGRGEGEDRSEKSVVPTGFSLDIGGLCPSGKTGVYELIGTPDQLAQFQTVEWLKRNEAEIILVNALTLSSYLTGERALVERYQREVNSILNTKIGSRMAWSRKKLRQERAFQLMRGFVDEFQPRLDQEKADLRAFDVKKELYRLPQTVISGLALYYGLEGNSTLERVEELRRAKTLSRMGANRLKAVFKSILKLRAEVHLFYGTEKEILYHPRAEEATEERLLTISPKLSQQLLEIYRTLIPLHEGARAFLAGDRKALARSTLYHSSIGNYDDALRENLNYPAALEAAHGAVAFNPDSSSQSNLGLVHLDMGQAQKALSSLEEAYLLLKREHGDRPHREVASSLTELGIAYDELGETRQAINYHKQSLAISKQIYGERPHRDVACSLSNLGNAYRALGETRRAIDYDQQSLAMFKQIHGKEPHPDVANSLDNLGTAYSALGETRRAIDTHQQSLAMFKLIHGDRPHPDVATSLKNLGTAYSALGKTRQAIDTHQQSLAMFKLIHGDRPHPDVASSLGSLGNAYYELGGPWDAIDTPQASSLAIYKAMHKLMHGDRPNPDLAILGTACDPLGEARQAINYHKQSLAMYKEIHDDRPHPDVALSLANLGSSYLASGKRLKAIELLQKSYKISLKTVGAEHPLAEWIKGRLDAANKAH